MWLGVVSCQVSGASVRQHYKWALSSLSQPDTVVIWLKNCWKRPVKPGQTTTTTWRISIYHQSSGNRVHRIGQSGVASSEREQMTTKQRGSARLNESAKSAKPEPRHHHRSQFSELTCSIYNRQFKANKWPDQSTREHTNTHKFAHRIIKPKTCHTQFFERRTKPPPWKKPANQETIDFGQAITR